MALLAAASSMSACIIPVAPDFQDQPSRPNSAPSITNLNPAHFGATFAIQGSQAFSAAVSDPDGDTLYVVWAIDYPPYTSATWQDTWPPISPPAVNQPTETSVSLDISCGNILNPSSSAHKVELIVADAPLTMPNPSLPYSLDTLATPGVGIIAYAYWNISIPCQAPQSTP